MVLDTTSNSNISSKQQADIQEKQNKLKRSIIEWRDIQLTYMPQISTLLQETNPSDDAESMPLFLPSSLPSSLHTKSTILELSHKELRLRNAQAYESLEKVRHGRQMITGLLHFRKHNISGAGNRPNTRFRSVVNHIQSRINHAVSMYRIAYKALQSLNPDGTSWMAKFQELKPNDIRGPSREQGESNGKYEMSWIWLIGKKGPLGGEEDETLQPEWAKMKARKD